jgi:hypothetical protein
VYRAHYPSRNPKQRLAMRGQGNEGKLAEWISCRSGNIVIAAAYKVEPTISDPLVNILSGTYCGSWASAALD